MGDVIRQLITTNFEHPINYRLAAMAAIDTDRVLIQAFIKFS